MRKNLYLWQYEWMKSSISVESNISNSECSSSLLVTNFSVHSMYWDMYRVLRGLEEHSNSLDYIWLLQMWAIAWSGCRKGKAHWETKVILNFLLPPKDTCDVSLIEYSGHRVHSFRVSVILPFLKFFIFSLMVERTISLRITNRLQSYEEIFPIWISSHMERANTSLCLHYSIIH